MAEFLVISVHDFRSRRKASVHFIAQELARRGPTRFFSTGASRLAEYRGDTRTDLAPRANRIETVDGVACYLQRGIWHPFRLKRPALRTAEEALFRLYRWRMPRVLRQWIRDAETVFVESGLAAIYVPDIKRLNPTARIVYLASDDLAVVGAAQTIQKSFRDNFDLIDLVRLPSPLLLEGMPHGRSAMLAPQGVDRVAMDMPYPSPFGERRTCVSVGSMLFDASFFNIAAPDFPDIDFHIIGAGKAALALDAHPNVIVHPEMPFVETLAYLQHTAVGIAPYRDADMPRYLLDTSLKLRQFGFYGKPAVCPDFAAGDAAGRFAYRPGNRASIISALSTALSNETPITVDLLPWSAIVDRLLEPERFPEHRIDPTSTKPCVAIYRTELLPLSETFIRDQALSLRRWKPALIGERTAHKLPLQGLDVRASNTGPATLMQKVRGVVCRRLDRPIPGLMKIARSAGPRLIHAHFGFDGVEAWPIAKRLNVPLLVTLHGSDITTRMDWFSAGRSGRRWRGYPKRLLRLAQEEDVHFIAVSGPIRDAAIKAGLPAHRITVRHIGIDASRFAPMPPSPGQRKPVILFIGRLVEKKGVGVLLDAFERLQKTLPDAQLIIGGDGPLRDKLEARARAVPSVTFLGAVSGDTVRTLMTEARVFCLPSITAASGDREGFGLVLLEAQACGVPVVTSASGGSTEGMIDGETGFAFAENDVVALTQHLLTLLQDNAVADRMGLAARHFVEHAQDLHLCTTRLEEVYDSLIGRGR